MKALQAATETEKKKDEERDLAIFHQEKYFAH
jgi:hypothetical protein